MKVSGWKTKLLSNCYDNRTNFGLFHISQDERDFYFEGLRWRSTMRKNGVQRAYWTVTPQCRLKRAWVSLKIWIWIWFGPGLSLFCFSISAFSAAIQWVVQLVGILWQLFWYSTTISGTFDIKLLKANDLLPSNIIHRKKIINTQIYSLHCLWCYQTLTLTFSIFEQRHRCCVAQRWCCWIKKKSPSAVDLSWGSRWGIEH